MLSSAAIIVRRLFLLACATIVICATTWLVVDAFARTPMRTRRERAWTKPEWSSMPASVGGELLLIAGAALIGRRVLRLRL